MTHRSPENTLQLRAFRMVRPSRFNVTSDRDITADEGMAHIIRLRGEQMHLYPASQLDWRHYDGSSCGAGNTSGVEEEMNKVVVFQLHSELKQAQNGVTTAKSSVVHRMIESR